MEKYDLSSVKSKSTKKEQDPESASKISSDTIVPPDPNPENKPSPKKHHLGKSKSMG